MADINPEESEQDRAKAAAAANEHSGYSVEGDTPPAEGLGVGPTNNELDRDRPGDSTRPKIILTVLAVLLALFVVLAIAGRIIGFF
ncbi:DUF6480 family protein [Kocuria tytonis]|uniref:Uncharacterized protein n=1 Tax=Kocuria tytonis TaxID=2054280 RepID=A0A495A681_9MICC|nr:DUF6480 family protein [Kocuria tytonis]RKQ35214.1 hypothetical protein C1C97_008190 [Kocuria tytonis]